MSCASFLTTSILATGFIDQMRDLSKLSGEQSLSARRRSVHQSATDAGAAVPGGATDRADHSAHRFVARVH